MASPTPTTTTNWDGTIGLLRWRCAWVPGDSDFTDGTLVDVSALSSAPPRNAVKITRLDVVMNGNFSAIFQWKNVASGVVNTTTLNTRATWVSGDVFNTAWASNPGLFNDGKITINGVEYTITTVDSSTQITLASDPGNQTGVAYGVDEIFEVFIGQSDVSCPFLRDYSGGPHQGLVPTKTSSTRTGATGDLLLTTSGAASGDELSIKLSFSKD